MGVMQKHELLRSLGLTSASVQMHHCEHLGLFTTSEQLQSLAKTAGKQVLAHKRTGVALCGHCCYSHIQLQPGCTMTSNEASAQQYVTEASET